MGGTRWVGGREESVSDAVRSGADRHTLPAGEFT